MNKLTFLGLLPLLPALVIAITILLTMIVISVKRSYALTTFLTVLGLNAALVVSVCQFFGLMPNGVVGSLFVVDGFAAFNSVVVLIAALACVALAYRYFDGFHGNKEELFLLLLTSTLGAVLMTSAQHFASFFMSLELLSVPMYGMLGFAFLKMKSLEAGLKYLILSAAASATLLMGMAFIYAAVGSLSFAGIGRELLLGMAFTPLFALGAVMMIVAAGFKLSLAPFHAWVGDVYEGAPAPIATFLASVGKVAVMALLLRFFMVSTVPVLVAVDTVLTWLIVLSILLGNLLAVYQDNLKRMLAFSSVSHMGYVLIAVASVGAAADERVAMYMAIYALTAVGAFGVMTLMSGKYTPTESSIMQKTSDEADHLSVYQGLFWRRPILTAVMTVMLLSMAGMPTTAGFITKMQILFAAVEGGRFWLAGMVILGSAVGLYYYLKVILIMYKRPIEQIDFDVADDWRLKANGLMVLLVVAIVIFFWLVSALAFCVVKYGDHRQLIKITVKQW